MLILEPIFEADMPQEQHAFRQNRNAQSAVREVRGLLASGHKDVVDADLRLFPSSEIRFAVSVRFLSLRAQSKSISLDGLMLPRWA
jgi:hypothetical protein